MACPLCCENTALLQDKYSDNSPSENTELMQDRELTAVGDDTDGGVAFSETRDWGEAHLVGFRLYQFSQVMCHELSFVDRSIHRDLLLPPALQPHLD